MGSFRSHRARSMRRWANKKKGKKLNLSKDDMKRLYEEFMGLNKPEKLPDQPYDASQNSLSKKHFRKIGG
jgi:hypothetical protein